MRVGFDKQRNRQDVEFDATESIFAEMLHQTEKGENVVMEIERGLAECAAKKDEPAIEVEDDEPGASGVKRSQEMPPPVSTPRANKAPVQLDKPALKIEKPEVKARLKMPEKEKRRDYEGEGEKKKQCYDYESLEVVDRKEVPKDLLYAQLTQQQWDVMGRDSRQRVLKEQVTEEECFFFFPVRTQGLLLPYDANTRSSHRETPPTTPLRRPGAQTQPLLRLLYVREYHTACAEKPTGQVRQWVV